MNYQVMVLYDAYVFSVHIYIFVTNPTHFPSLLDHNFLYLKKYLLTKIQCEHLLCSLRPSFAAELDTHTKKKKSTESHNPKNH